LTKQIENTAKKLLICLKRHEQEFQYKCEITPFVWENPDV